MNTHTLQSLFPKLCYALCIGVLAFQQSCMQPSVRNTESYKQKIQRLVSGEALYLNKKVGQGSVILKSDSTLAFSVNIFVDSKHTTIAKIASVLYVLLPDDIKTTESDFISSIARGTPVTCKSNSMLGVISLAPIHVAGVSKQSISIVIDLKINKTNISKMKIISFLFEANAGGEG